MGMGCEYLDKNLRIFCPGYGSFGLCSQAEIGLQALSGEELLISASNPSPEWGGVV
jgi:hypothetical protein